MARRWRIHARENWYRDVWLALISGVVVLSLLSARSAISQIQQSRLALCRDQNTRRAQTIRTLDRELPRLERGAPPARRAQIHASRTSTVALINQLTVALINQLAPHQNCTAVIRSRTPRQR